MPADFNGADPTPTSERMVYLVKSDTGKGTPYRVDLTANGGAGQCACKDWNTRRGPALKAGKPMHTTETACKHILKVHRYFLKHLLVDMAKSEES
jgi:hypothetical protein